MSAFGDAFKAARAAGKKTFTFNGKSYHTRTKEEEAKAKPKSDSAKNDSSKPKSDAAKPMPKSEFMDLLDRNNPSSKYMKKLPDNRPPAKGATFSEKGAPERKSPEMKKLPDNRADRTKAPEMVKTDDTSLSLSERMKRTKERARTSNTGTDTRSVSQRIKEAIGMKKGGSVKAAKKGSKARGGGAATRGTKFSGVF